MQRKDPGLQIVYLASSERQNIDLQIIGALRLHGISPLDSPEMDKDIIGSKQKLGDREPDLNSITRYLTHTRYASVNLSPQHTQCIIEVPRKKSSLDLCVCIYSWLEIPKENLQVYLQRNIIDTLYRNGIQEKDSKLSQISERYLDRSKAFTTSTALRFHA